jgi:hypothetical protein
VATTVEAVLHLDLHSSAGCHSTPSHSKPLCLRYRRRCAFCAYEWLLINANGVSAPSGGGPKHRRLQQLLHLPIITSSGSSSRRLSAQSPFSWYPSTDSGMSSICAVSNLECYMTHSNCCCLEACHARLACLHQVHIWCASLASDASLHKP